MELQIQLGCDIPEDKAKTKHDQANCQKENQTRKTRANLCNFGLSKSSKNLYFYNFHISHYTMISSMETSFLKMHVKTSDV